MKIERNSNLLKLVKMVRDFTFWKSSAAKFDCGGDTSLVGWLMLQELLSFAIYCPVFSKTLVYIPHSHLPLCVPAKACLSMRVDACQLTYYNTIWQAVWAHAWQPTSFVLILFLFLLLHHVDIFMCILNKMVYAYVWDFCFNWGLLSFVGCFWHHQNIHVSLVMYILYIGVRVVLVSFLCLHNLVTLPVLSPW